MNAPLNIAGERYGRLVAVSKVASKSSHTRWLFRCDCGVQKEIGLVGVREGRVTSCGCYQRETAGAHSVTHGHRRGREETPELSSWYSAKSRCFCSTDPKYQRYGGRGITMCGEWVDDFAAFLAYMGPRPEGTTLDRKDPDKGYEPGNCRWATSAEQARTRTDNVFVEHAGQRLILKDFAVAVGVNYKRLSYLMRKRSITAQEAAACILA